MLLCSYTTQYTVSYTVQQDRVKDGYSNAFVLMSYVTSLARDDPNNMRVKGEAVMGSGRDAGSCHGKRDKASTSPQTDK